MLKTARIAFANQISLASTTTASHDQAGTVALNDGMTTIKWRPANLTPTIQYNGSFTGVDYIGLAGVNWKSADCSLVVKDSLGTTVAIFLNLDDNESAIVFFTKADFSTLLFEFTCLSTSLEVGEIYFGESLALPSGASIGYQPGRWSNNDIVTSSETENNEFSGSTIRAKGLTERFTINFINTEFMDTTYKTFILAAQGLPIFFSWDDTTEQSIYGIWSASDPVFTSSISSSIDVTINGS